ncbi:MAG: hypoxanthine phosphoribosyltransferase [Paludibacteraceae bacterium]|nr:hypoxanthine phosphoribosyltransferase [Paludibacteraceae bacterium]
MREVQFQGMTFEEMITPSQISEIVSRVAEQINNDYAGRQPLFICVLNGAFVFAADLYRKITLPADITFVRLKSYTGMSHGEIRQVLPIYEDIRDRDVIVIEDIVDTGHSMHHFMKMLREQGVRSAEICSFLFKPEALEEEDARPKYVGKEIPKRFIVGYGLDLDEQGRNLDAVYVLPN